jgi:hypothetical protein
MRRHKDRLWTWLLPEEPRGINEDEWARSGGKWIVFDKEEKILNLAEKLAPLVDSGEVASAKYWNGDPSAICVYSLDRARDKTWGILKRLGAGDSIVWEYDFAWDKNIREPLEFLFSWSSKFRTIVQSYGVFGTLRLIREVLIGSRK